MIDFTAIPERANGPLFCDLLGRRVLYKGNKKKEQTIQVLYFQAGHGKEVDVSKVPCGYHEVNKKGEMDVSKVHFMFYKELVEGVTYKPISIKKKAKKKGAKKNGKRKR